MRKQFQKQCLRGQQSCWKCLTCPGTREEQAFTGMQPKVHSSCRSQIFGKKGRGEKKNQFTFVTAFQGEEERVGHKVSRHTHPYTPWSAGTVWHSSDILCSMVRNSTAPLLSQVYLTHLNDFSQKINCITEPTEVCF